MNDEMKRFLLSLAALLAAAASLLAQRSDVLSVKSYVLDNGMQVWINEDPSHPTAYGAVVVKAGARDCPGEGLAHYFEHIMFKGTEDFGTVDYPAEKVYLDQIEEQYKLLWQTEDEAKRTEIQKEINRLNIAAAKYAIPNEFDVLTAVCGGTGLNAYTSQDETVYHSGFIPAFFDQWAQINSDRLINPVFRLFQGELETVYEEKNRMKDNAITMFALTGMERFYAPSPYSESVIGKTFNLKNPRLDLMKEFFEKYYVASNMGLVITGDVKAEEILPVIERTFGRIRRGTPLVHAPIELPAFKGREVLEVKANIPLIKITAMAWRVPSPKQPENTLVALVTQMLNNEEGVGLLDKLMVDGKVMAAASLYGLSYADAGVFPLLVIPKLVGQKPEAAQELVLAEIDRLRRGDFDDAFLQRVKASYKKSQLTALEDQWGRMNTMVQTLSRDKRWEDVLAEIESVDAVTREDIMAFVQKYLGDNRLEIVKKMGAPENDNLSKPPYDKVVPESRDAVSAYAAALEAEAAKIPLDIPELDFSRDVTVADAAPLVKVYAGANPLNDVFELTLRFRTGTIDNPALEPLASYLNLLGTKEKSYEEIRAGLQEIGGSIVFSSGIRSFEVQVTGFDAQFEETLSRAFEMLGGNLAGDKKKLAQIAQDIKAGKSTSRKDLSSLSAALFHYAVYGDASPELADPGKLTDERLLPMFGEVLSTQCDVFYTGALDAAAVAGALRAHMDLSRVTKPVEAYRERRIQAYPSSRVLFVDQSGSNQTQFYAYIPTDVLDTREKRDMASFYNTYLGENMTSVLFQEVREFRSYAYSTGSALLRPVWKNRAEQGSALVTVTGTQCDKTMEALSLVDSLLQHLPVTENKLEIKKKECINDLYHNYPAFRAVPEYVQQAVWAGDGTDNKKEQAANFAAVTPASLAAFSRAYVEGRPVVWCVVGDAKKIDMKALSQYGPVTVLKAKDIIK